MSIQLKDFLSGDLINYYLCLPEGYNLTKVVDPDMDWGETLSYRYSYNNGILFYFGNSPSAMDDRAIVQALGEKHRYNYLVGNVFLLDPHLVESMEIPDFWDLSGKDKKHKYWRDVQTFSWTIGYRGVPKRHLATYDSIVDSFVKTYYPCKIEN